MDEIHLPMVKSFINIYEKPIYLISQRSKEYEDVEKLVPHEYRKENEKLIRVYLNSQPTISITAKKHFRI